MPAKKKIEKKTKPIRIDRVSELEKKVRSIITTHANRIDAARRDIQRFESEIRELRQEMNNFMKGWRELKDELIRHASKIPISEPRLNFLEQECVKLGGRIDAINNRVTAYQSSTAEDQFPKFTRLLDVVLGRMA